MADIDSSYDMVPINGESEVTQALANGKKKGSFRQRTYTLNDVGALKKKMKHENGRRLDFEIGKEAKDFSNIVVPMKASFFEFFKAYFVNELAEQSSIHKVENVEAVKAATENNGDAIVEYSVDIEFTAKQDHTHAIKLTAYTTTSQLFIQPIREKSGPREHLGNKSTPRYFTECFIIPWCEKAVKDKRFNESLRNYYSNSLKEAIKKLDLDKMKTPRLNTDNTCDSANKAPIKCVAKVCSYQGLNPNNKAAVGACENCGSFEHFVCVGINHEHKEEIIGN